MSTSKNQPLGFNPDLPRWANNEIADCERAGNQPYLAVTPLNGATALLEKGVPGVALYVHGKRVHQCMEAEVDASSHRSMARQLCSDGRGGGEGCLSDAHGMVRFNRLPPLVRAALHAVRADVVAGTGIRFQHAFVCPTCGAGGECELMGVSDPAKGEALDVACEWLWHHEAAHGKNAWMGEMPLQTYLRAELLARVAATEARAKGLHSDDRERDHAALGPRRPREGHVQGHPPPLPRSVLKQSTYDT